MESLMLYNHLNQNLYSKTIMIDYEKNTINAFKIEFDETDMCFMKFFLRSNRS